MFVTVKIIVAGAANSTNMDGALDTESSTFKWEAITLEGD